MARKQKQQAVLESVRDALVRDIIEAVQADPIKWAKSWSTQIARSGLASNAATGDTYRGGNQMVLTLSAMAEDREANVWATYRQWQQVGAQVRRNEKGTQCFYWDRFAPKSAEPDPDTGEVRKVWFARSFSVFNLAQVEVLDSALFGRAHVPTARVAREDEVYPGAEILGALPVSYRYGDPAYDRRHDVVRMPDVSDFGSPAKYAAVLSHELVHWTGHESRLDRPRHAKWGDDAYAYEELVAELGAVMLCGLFGIEHETRSDHVGYLQHWVGRLGDDPQALWTAATQASRAVELISGGVGESSGAAALV